MTVLVFVTQTGTRYHASTGEKCMESARSFAEVDLATAAAGGLMPCITCGAPPLPDVSEGDLQWLRAIDDWARGGVFDSIWEQAFARRVLANVPGITVDDVEPQAYIKAGAETVKVDFFIPKARLVLEVDGYAKDGHAPTPSDLERRNRRDAALQNDGMTVLHFTNAQVQGEPTGCRQQVAAAVSKDPVLPELPPPAVIHPTPVSTTNVVASPPTSASSPAGQVQSKSNGKGVWIGVAVVAALLIIVAVVALSSRSSGVDPGTGAPTVAASKLPTNGECPTDFPYKGNINDQQERIVHAPGQRFYDRTDAEMCFSTVDAAVAAGYRQSQQ